MPVIPDTWEAGPRVSQIWGQSSRLGREIDTVKRGNQQTGMLS